jgi:hypothetical protein
MVVHTLFPVLFPQPVHSSSRDWLLFIMLLDRHVVAGLASLWAASTVNAAPCRSNLIVDNFTKWTNGVNNLDWPNGGEFGFVFPLFFLASCLPSSD